MKVSKMKYVLQDYLVLAQPSFLSHSHSVVKLDLLTASPWLCKIDNELMKKEKVDC